MKKIFFFILVFIVTATLFSLKVELQKEVYNLGVQADASPVAFDINGDGVVEIIVCDTGGYVTVINGKTVEHIFRVKVGSNFGTAPLIGNFFGDLRFDIAVLDRDGTLYIINLSSPYKILSYRTTSPSSSSPAVYDVDNDGADDVIFGNDSGSIYAFSPKKEKTIWINKDFSYTVRTPVTIGNITGDEKYEIVYGLGNGYIVVISEVEGELIELKDESGTSTNVSEPVRLRSGISNSFGIGDVNNDGTNDVISVCDSGFVYALSYKDKSISSLNIIWQPPLKLLDDSKVRDDVWGAKREFKGLLGERDLHGSNPSSPILLDINNDKYLDIIVAAHFDVMAFDGKYYGIYDGTDLNNQPDLLWSSTGKGKLIGADFKPWSLRYPTIKHLALLSTGRPDNNLLVVLDNHGNMILCDPLTGNELMQEINTQSTNIEASPIIADFNADGLAEIALIDNENTKLRIFKTDVKCQKSQVFWATEGGNFWHTSSISGDVYTLFDNKQAKLRGRIEELTRQLKDNFEKEKDYSESLDIAEEILKLDISNPYALKIRSDSKLKLFQKRNYKYIYFAFFISTILIIFLALYIYKKLYKNFYRKLALKLFNNNDFIRAKGIYEKLLHRGFKDIEIYKLYADTLIALKEYGPETVNIYEKANKHFPQDEKYLIGLSKTLLQAGQKDDFAITIFNKVYDVFDEKILLETNLGRIYIERGELVEAKKWLEKAYKKVPTNEGIINSLAETLIKLNLSGPSTLEILKKAHEIDPKNLNLSIYLSNVYADLHLFNEESKKLFMNILEYTPDNKEALLHMGQALYFEKDYPQAINYMKKALTVDPEYYPAIQFLCRGYLKTGKTNEEALDVYLKAYYYDEENQKLLRIICDIFLKNKRTDKLAYSIYKKTLFYDRTNIVLLKMLSRLAEAFGNYDDVIEYNKNLIQLGFKDDKVVMRLAKAYAEKGALLDEAMQIYEEALTLEPANEMVKDALCKVYIDRGIVSEKAIEVYISVYERNPDDLKLQYQLARAFYETKHYKESIDILKNLLSKQPDDEEAKQLLARANISANQLDEAINYYNARLEKNPEDKDAILNLAVAYAHKGITDPKIGYLYDQALAINPQEPSLHVIKGKIYRLHKELDNCLMEFYEAYKIDRNVADAIVTDCRRLIEENPNYLKGRKFLGELLIEANEYEKAIEQLQVVSNIDKTSTAYVLKSYDKIISRDNRNVLALVERGIVKKLNGDIMGALADLEKAYELSPSNKEVLDELEEIYEHLLEKGEKIEYRFMLGKVYLDNDKVDKALRIFQKTSTDPEYEKESQKMLGKCFIKKNMLDFAYQHLMKLHIDEEVKVLLYELGEMFERAGNFTGAKAVYKTLFASDIDFKDVRDKIAIFADETGSVLTLDKTSILPTGLEETKQEKRYELLKELGKGAMGVVVQAKDKELDEIVALKILPPNLAANDEAVRRFRVEARAARKLSHKNIVRIHDMGEQEGRKFISMEFVSGTDLKDILMKGGKLKIDVAIDYAVQICSALAYAHELGIVHRDIKPANIMVTEDGQVKVADFGIAKMMESDMTGTGAVIGTPLYMSPEQIKGESVDQRIDIYSFGCLFYEMLQGKPPFYEGDLSYQHIHVEPKPIEEIPDEINAIVLKCLAKEKNDRYPNVKALLKDLRKFTQKRESGTDY